MAKRNYNADIMFLFGQLINDENDRLIFESVISEELDKGWVITGKLSQELKDTAIQATTLTFYRKLVSYLEDGKYDTLTTKAAIKAKPKEKKKAKTSILDDKENIMDYLGREEGLILHFNSRESDYTTPYGVYKKNNKGTPLIRYIDRILKDNNLNPYKKSHRDKFNTILKKSPVMRRRIRDMAWDIYKKDYIDTKVTSLLGEKSTLSWFSNSVNSGMRRSNIILQRALGITDDGVAGPQTRKAIKNSKLTDKQLNQRILYYMDKFYEYLIHTDADTYAVNENGWANRLNRLGFKTKKSKYTMRYA